MARRKRDAAQADLESTLVQTPSSPAPKEASATLQIKGTPQEISEHLRQPTEETNGHGKPAEEPENEFFKLLDNAKLMVVIERDEPMEWNGIKCEGEVKQFKLPRTWQSMSDWIKKNCGGRKYRAMAVNPKNGDILAAHMFDVDADPVVTEADMPPGQYLEHELEREANDPLVKLEREQIEIEHQIKIEDARQKLDELKDRKLSGRAKAGDNEAIKELQLQIIRMEYEGKLQVQNARIEGLQKMVESGPPSTRRDGEDPVLSLMKMMQENQRRSDERFEKLVERMNNDKMDAVLQELRESRTKKDGGGLSEQIELFRDMAKMFGVKIGRGDESEDDREWWQVIIEESVPKVFDLIENTKATTGAAPDRKQVSGMMSQILDEEIAKRKAAGVQPGGRALPAGASAIPTAPKTAAPVAAPVAVPTTTPAPNTSALVSPTPEPPKIPTVEQERVMRSSVVMDLLAREAQIRPKEWTWTEGAWTTLPADILASIGAAAGPLEMLKVFEGVLGSSDNMKALVEKIKADPAMAAWLGVGLQELKEWVAEAVKDPKFDPFADDDED